MKTFPIKIANSDIHFALRGRLNNGFELLVISFNCPVALFNAAPINSAGETSGRLRRICFNLLSRDYNWAYSDYLPKIDQPVGSASGDQHDEPPSFQPESRLQFAWRGYSNKSLRARVKKQLDLHRLDLCKAILAHDEIGISNALAPIILECEGYTIGT